MSAGRAARTLEVLIVEDNPGDVRLVAEALKLTEAPSSLSVAADGVEALAFLRRQGQYVDSPRPHVILLDLNMPRKDGREVLAEIKCDANLRRIPVIVLTSSRDERDVFEAYDLCANCYVAKPIDFDQFAEVVRCIEAFWATVAELPLQ